MTEKKYNREEQQLKSPLQLQTERGDRRDSQFDLYYDKDL